MMAETSTRYLFNFFVLLMLLYKCAACPNFPGVLNCSCDVANLECYGSRPQNTSLLSEILQTVHSNHNKTWNSIKIAVQDLESFPEFAFENCTIKELAINDAGIKSISDDVFTGIYDGMLNLDFSNNLFYKVPSDSVAKLPKLEEFNLSNNAIAEIRRADFMALDNLKYLILNHNNITLIEMNAFRNLESLIELDLEHNKLSSVKNEMFTGLKHLETLYLGVNNFTSLLSINITSLSLKILSLKNNTISGELLGDLLCGVSNLEELDLSFNKINKITLNNSCGIYLQLLNVSFNSASFIGKESFDSLQMLTNLDLQKNAIFHIEENAFSHLVHLEYLNLNDNKLKVLLCQYTANLHSLIHIDLKNNKIETVLAGTFTYSASLTHIAFNDNPFKCNCHLYDFAQYLKNNHGQLAVYVADTAICASPPELAGSRVIDVDYNGMSCSAKKPCISTALLAKTTDSITTTEVTTTVHSLPVNILLLESAFKFSKTGDGKLCIKWHVNGLQKDVAYTCNLHYEETGTGSEVSIPLDCPSANNSNVLFDCFTILSLEEGVLYDVCLSIGDGTKASMAKNCSNSVAVPSATTTTLIIPTTTIINNTTTTLVMQTNSALSEQTSLATFTHVNDTSLSTVTYSIPSTLQTNATEKNLDVNVSTKLFSSVTTSKMVPQVTRQTMPDLETNTIGDFTVVLQERTTVKEVEQNEFFIVVFSVISDEPNNVMVKWTVNRNQASNLCKIKLIIWMDGKIIREANFNCVKNSFHLSGLEKSRTYKICLNSSHQVFGSTSNCTVLTYSSPSSGALQSNNPGRFPFFILIALVIVVSLIVVIIVIRTIVRRRTASEIYKVSIEEKKYSNRQSYAFSVTSESDCMLEQPKNTQCNI